jgi:hypothetical protein
MNALSGFLYAEPSTAEGVARVLDLGGTLTEFNASLSEGDADRYAIRADWRAVGCDLALVLWRPLSLGRRRRR